MLRPSRGVSHSLSIGPPCETFLIIVGPLSVVTREDCPRLLLDKGLPLRVSRHPLIEFAELRWRQLCESPAQLCSFATSAATPLRECGTWAAPLRRRLLRTAPLPPAGAPLRSMQCQVSRAHHWDQPVDRRQRQLHLVEGTLRQRRSSGITFVSASCDP